VKKNWLRGYFGNFIKQCGNLVLILCKTKLLVNLIKVFKCMTVDNKKK